MSTSSSSTAQARGATSRRSEVGAGSPAVAGAPTSPVRKVPLRMAARRLTVLRVEDLSRSMRRVVLGGPELSGFVSDGPIDHFKLFFPDASGALVMPRLDEERWVNRDDPGLVYRDYTVRTFGVPALTHDAAVDELVVDLAVHDHGPAGRWAGQAAPGQELGTLGPRSTKAAPLDRDWYVLAGDETGLPGVLNWLDRLPEQAPVQVLLEVDGPADEVELPARAATTVTWLHRNGAPAGSTSLLSDAVAAADFGARAAGESTGTGLGWVWAAAEASAVRAIRTHVTAERGLDRSSFAMTGFWRLGVENFDHHSPEA